MAASGQQSGKEKERHLSTKVVSLPPVGSDCGAMGERRGSSEERGARNEAGERSARSESEARGARQRRALGAGKEARQKRGVSAERSPEPGARSAKRKRTERAHPQADGWDGRGDEDEGERLGSQERGARSKERKTGRDERGTTRVRREELGARREEGAELEARRGRRREAQRQAARQVHSRWGVQEEQDGAWMSKKREGRGERRSKAERRACYRAQERTRREEGLRGGRSTEAEEPERCGEELPVTAGRARLTARAENVRVSPRGAR
eukprot:2130817-Rhodomonas_salina.1